METNRVLSSVGNNTIGGDTLFHQKVGREKARELQEFNTLYERAPENACEIVNET